MQVILLFLFSVFAFSQSDCDLRSLEEQCFNKICKPSSKSTIPSEKLDLLAESAGHRYVLPKEALTRVDSLAKKMNEVKATARKHMSEEGFNHAVEEMIRDPLEGLDALDHLFQGEFSCLDIRGTCRVLTSNLSRTPKGLLSAYKELWESTYFIRNLPSLDISTSKPVLQKMLNEVKASLSEADYEKELKKINSLRPNELFIYFDQKNKWLPLFNKKVGEKLSSYKKDITAALKVKAQGLMSLDYSKEAISRRVKASCRGASYFQEKINSNVDPLNFQIQKMEVMKKFKNEFLTKLSPSTAQELSKSLTPESFQLIDHKENFLPGEPSLGFQSEKASSLKSLSDLSLLETNEDYGCRLGVFGTEDHYKYEDNKIYISKNTLAFGYGDVFSHELGHWLSDKESSGKVSEHSGKKLQVVKECVDTFYPKHDASDSSKAEEDFADWFAGKLRYQESGVFCDLRKMMGFLFNVQDAASIYSPSKTDSHSNWLFRELTIRLNRGEALPQVCREMMNAYPDYQPKKCEM